MVNVVYYRPMVLKKSRENILYAIVSWRLYALQINIEELLSIDSLFISTRRILANFLAWLHIFDFPMPGQMLLPGFFNTIGRLLTLGTLAARPYFPVTARL
jgi:hypothetical protein